MWYKNSTGEIQFVDWVDKEVFKGEIPKKSEMLVRSNEMQNSTGNTPFKFISEYALSHLS